MSRKGHVMGSKPAKDPWEDVEGGGFSVTSGVDIKWANRVTKESFTIPLLFTILSFIGVFWFTWSVILGTLVSVIFLYLMLKVKVGGITGQGSTWESIPEADIILTKGKKTVECTGAGRTSIVGMYLKKAPLSFPHDLSAVIRAVPMPDGLCIKVTMTRAEPKDIEEGGILVPRIEKYLKTPSNNAKEYVGRYKGLWNTRVTVLGLLEDTFKRGFFESSIRGALPSKKWKRIKSEHLMGDIRGMRTPTPGRRFYAVSNELTEWLIQLRSELSGEVGVNIPGQFIAPIRPKTADYVLGTVLNPDTLQIGPPTGLTHEEISNGLLVCGNTWHERRCVLMLLVKQMLDSGKRVLLISSSPEAHEFTALNEAAVGMTLGGDLVINPVDPELVHRSSYVPQLMMALETLTEKNLSASSDVETALGRTVALANATIADIQFVVDETLGTDVDSSTFPKARLRETILGMEAIRRLQSGVGARAFYGSQTVNVERLTQLPLSVLVFSTGSTPLEIFAWDLFMMKLAGVKEDKDLVVILDDPENLRVMVKRLTRREPWVERLMRPIAQKFSLIVAMDQPSLMTEGVKNSLSSCVSLRLRSERDIASVSSMLGLSVLGTGMHSKARWSPRESSYLRSMEDGNALIVYNTMDTCQPVILNKVPTLLVPSREDMAVRLSTVKTEVASVDDSPRPLIDSVAGRDGDLAKDVLKLLERYEPLTEEAVRKFIQAAGVNDADVEGVLIRLRESGMILEGHENHSGVSYKNYRLTMKGTMTLRQASAEAST